MKIAANNVEGLVKKIDPSIYAVLLYGPDVGLVSIRAEAISKQIVEDLSDPFLVTNLEPEKIKEDTSLLADEFNSISFGGGKKIIRVKGADNNVTKALKEFFSTNPDNSAFLLVTAGELTNKSSLRKLFEDGKSIASLPCYTDDERALWRIINDAMKQKGLNAEKDAISYIASNCQGDRMIVVQELEKLELYLGERRDITLKDAMESVGQTTETALDDINQSVADGNLKEAERHLGKAIGQGVVSISVLRSLERYFMRIRKVQGMMQQGKSQDVAINSLRPPVFFKHKAVFNKHLTTWSRRQGRRVDSALAALYQAELECKQTGSNPDLISNRCVMKIASLAR